MSAAACGSQATSSSREATSTAAPESRGAPRLADVSDDDTVLAVTPNDSMVILEVARGQVKRTRGLMFRESIPDGTGMLFVFEQAGAHSIWMYQCETTLDLIWLNDSLDVVHVEADVPPCRGEPQECPSYRPEQPVARYVIEVAGGHAQRLGFLKGARIELRPMAR